MLTPLEEQALLKVLLNLQDSKQINCIIFPSDIKEGKYDYEKHHANNSKKDRLIDDSMRWIEKLIASSNLNSKRS